VVGRLPSLAREVMARLPPPQPTPVDLPPQDCPQSLPYDPDAIQRLVVDLALDPTLWVENRMEGGDAANEEGDGMNITSQAEVERQLVAVAVLRVVASTNAGGRRYRLPQRAGYDLSAVLAHYEAFLNNPEQQKKRSYRMESASDLRSLWTEERIARFQAAFRKYGYGPTRNRMIAEAMGEGIHANQVADFKRRYKKVLIKEGRLEELKAIHGMRMKKIEQTISDQQRRTKNKKKESRIGDDEISDESYSVDITAEEASSSSLSSFPATAIIDTAAIEDPPDALEASEDTLDATDAQIDSAASELDAALNE